MEGWNEDRVNSQQEGSCAGCERHIKAGNTHGGSKGKRESEKTRCFQLQDYSELTPWHFYTVIVGF